MLISLTYLPTKSSVYEIHTFTELENKQSSESLTRFTVEWIDKCLYVRWNVWLGGMINS